MAQLFKARSNTIARVALLSVPVTLAVVLAAAYTLDRGEWNTLVGVARDQPVQFSHKHHVKDDGIDCRYCHNSVENSRFAGLPSTEVCMSCHSQIWSNATLLAPVRHSWVSGESLRWTRVHDLPEFVYFNHSMHINKGIGCSSCHGQVDEMPLMAKSQSLYMEFCLDCHRNPERHVRPKNEVYNMSYTPPSNQDVLGRQLVAAYGIRKRTDCVTCHR